MTEENRLLFDSVSVPLLYIDKEKSIILDANKSFKSEYIDSPASKGKSLNAFFKRVNHDSAMPKKEGCYIFSPPDKNPFLVKLFFKDLPDKDKNVEIVTILRISESSKEDVSRLKKKTNPILTGCKEPEKLIKKNMVLFRQLFNNSPVGVVMLDHEGRVVKINNSFKEIFGYGIHEIRGEFLDSFLIPENSKTNAENLTEKTLRGETFKIEAERIHKNGSKKSVVIGGGPVIIEEEIIAVFGIYVDISEQKRAEQEVKELNEQLEWKIEERTRQLKAANKELEAFSYSVSHDLRSPLHTIEGFSRFLTENYHDRLDQKGKNYLQRIRDSSKKMSALIDEFLALAKVSRTSLNLRQVDLSSIVRSLADSLKARNPERKVEFIISPDLTDMADPNLIEIVLQNLLENAWKFTSKQPTAKIEFGATVIENTKAYFVRDNGAGFNMKYNKKLFVPFKRLHKESEYPGTGVGLASVRRIINRHNGEVFAKAESGRGATFFFTLHS